MSSPFGILVRRLVRPLLGVLPVRICGVGFFGLASLEHSETVWLDLWVLLLDLWVVMRV